VKSVGRNGNSTANFSAHSDGSRSHSLERDADYRANEGTEKDGAAVVFGSGEIVIEAEKTEHIPPITTIEANPFPYQVGELNITMTLMVDYYSEFTDGFGGRMGRSA
jgi:hypothetical protein